MAFVGKRPPKASDLGNFTPCAVSQVLNTAGGRSQPLLSAEASILVHQRLIKISSAAAA